MKIRTSFIIFTILFLAIQLSPMPGPGALAAEMAGVTLEGTMLIDGQEAPLVGMGVRTKTFLKVKVYVAGLYMVAPSTDPAQIIGSDQAKAMVMKFVYKEVEGKKLQDSWREGFDSNTPTASADLKKRMDQFVSLFSGPAVKGDEYVFSYEPGKGTTVMLRGDVKATIPGGDFASALMAVWFGDRLGDSGLKALKKSILEGM